MKRRERTRILIEGDPLLRRRLREEVEAAYPVQRVAESSPGLVMMSARDGARDARFYLGEVLVTESRVQIAGRIGLGIVVGDDAQTAHDLAVIDAAYAASLNECAAWEALLLEEANSIAVREHAGEARILETRVSFATMDAE